MRVLTCLTIIALAAAATAENAVVENVAVTAATNSDDPVGDATDKAITTTKDAVNSAVNATEKAIDTIADKSAEAHRNATEAWRNATNDPTDSSAAPSVCQVSGFVMASLAFAGLALNFA